MGTRLYCSLWLPTIAASMCLFKGISGLHVFQTTCICFFQLAFHRLHCLAPPLLQVARTLAAESDMLAQARQKESFGDLQIIVPSQKICSMLASVPHWKLFHCVLVAKLKIEQCIDYMFFFFCPSINGSYYNLFQCINCVHLLYIYTYKTF